ncbi:MAG: AI-2E family transporter [Candidatus Parcubacteria bacterium]|nr:AI-2E family transporter [Candidatus Parcubacteria bacterium]
MDNINKKISIDISIQTLYKVLFLCALIILAYLIRGVIVILFFAFILVSILEPMVDWLKGKKVPKLLAVLIVYCFLLAVLLLIIILLTPPIFDQAAQLQVNFPNYWNKAIEGLSDFARILNNYGLADTFKSSLLSISQSFQLNSVDLLEKIGDFFSDILAGFVVLVITFYLLVEENAVKKILHSLMPPDYLPYALQMFNRIQKQLGLWLRGQLILCFCIFTLVYGVLLVLGVKYALIFAIIAGLLEFIPYLGPTFSGFIAVSITLMHSPLQALLVLICYIVIQVFENNILVPNIMRKAVGLNPVLSIVSLLVGATLGGFVGVIIAIPLATAVSVFFQDFLDQKHSREIKLE